MASEINLVGTDATRIESEGTRLLTDPAARSAFRPRDLFGDGRAAIRIALDLAGDPVLPWLPEAAL